MTDTNTKALPWSIKLDRLANAELEGDMDVQHEPDIYEACVNHS
jgi:hypothetical protein